MKYAREPIYGAVGYIAGVAILRTLPRATIPTGFDGRAAAFAVVPRSSSAPSPGGSQEDARMANA